MFYESTISPNMIWIDMKKFDFAKGSEVKTLSAEDYSLVGDVTKVFTKR
jgi:choloylglycine hydrolase